MVSSTVATKGMDARSTTARLLPVFTVTAGVAALLVVWLLLVARAVRTLSAVGVM
jgi:hypothetical protein